MDKEKMEVIKKAINNLQTKKVELISSYEEGYIGKKSYRVELNDGSIKNIEQITKNKGNGDAVVIIPITEDGNYVMIIESRPNIPGGVAIEFPAGMVDDGEEYDVAARRELLEETGYEADNIYELEWHYQDQGCSKAVIRTFVAEGCKKVREQELDNGEYIEYVEMTYDEILDVVKNSSYFNDANSKIAFMSYMLKQKGIL